MAVIRNLGFESSASSVLLGSLSIFVLFLVRLLLRQSVAADRSPGRPPPREDETGWCGRACSHVEKADRQAYRLTSSNYSQICSQTIIFLGKELASGFVLVLRVHVESSFNPICQFHYPRELNTFTFPATLSAYGTEHNGLRGHEMFQVAACL